MAVSVTCTAAVKTAAGLRVRWSDGSENEFTTLQEFADYVLSVDDDPEDAKKIALAKWKKANPTLNNTALIVGKTLTFDVTATPIIQVS